MTIFQSFIKFLSVTEPTIFERIFSTLGDILVFLIVLSLVICIHELGHFFFAKKAGVLCHEFSFGMGPKIWSKKKGETTFSIRAIPFGGFVSMAGEEISSDVVKPNHKIRIGFDEYGKINRIIVNPNNINYQDFPEITVTSIDLKGTEGNDLYINEYTVQRDAFYVFDKNQIQIAPTNRNFHSKTKWQRFMITFGGPMMNFVLAIFVYLIIGFIAGVPNMDSTVIGSVSENMPSSEILLPGDKIISINGVDISKWQASGDEASVQTELAKYLDYDSFVFVVERDGEEIELDPITPQYFFYGLGFVSTPNETELIIYSPLYQSSELLPGDKLISIDGVTFSTWNDVVQYQLTNLEGSSEDDPTVIRVERDGVEYVYSYVSYGEDVLEAMGYDAFYSRIGISSSTKLSFFGAIDNAIDQFVDAALSIYRTLALLFTSNQIGAGDLSGFIGIFSVTKQAASQGFLSLLGWIGLLSVNLGIINLLPIPALDGGRIMFIAYEAVTKKKPNQKVESILHTVVFFLLIALLIFITYNDILRLFTQR